MSVEITREEYLLAKGVIAAYEERYGKPKEENASASKDDKDAYNEAENEKPTPHK